MKSRFGEMLRQARESQYAVPAFNILNHLTLFAVLETASRLQSPVIIQTSVTTVKAMKPEALAALARTMIDTAPVPAVLHLDHCRDIAMCNQCSDLGWDAVMFDGSHLSFEENIQQTRQVRQYAQRKNVDVEGEVGVIAGVEDDISHDSASLAGLEDTLRYIGETSVDAIAPAIGTAHGVYHGTPVINFDLVEQLAAKTPCPVVVHGGTGLDDDTFRRLIAAGASKINISTAIKLAYVGALRSYLEKNTESVNPLKLDEFVVQQVSETVAAFMRLFGSAGKAA